ncbi:hypothetical protein [Sphingomonas sp. S2-65]|uniref:hypothetical protein n=1 Tax=Sphingomonas sp. S2-65 TaxID=2903960 RepID=UPI001F2CCAC7|nr:hypothetical protein [Sphingomonas sp. S2-65]UYY59320.1 hypothetical protein LZ586_04315 [Sphingomonas sp. S2-65]
MFLIVLALAFGAAYAAARWAFAARLDTLGERLKLKDDQIADRDRKLDELRQLAENPPPSAEVDGLETEDYSAVIRQLVADYIFDFEGSGDPDILSGRELPPLVWMNDQLAAMGKRWRIAAARGPVAEIEDR